MVGSGTHVVDALKAIRATGSRAPGERSRTMRPAVSSRRSAKTPVAPSSPRCFPERALDRLATDQEILALAKLKNVTDVSPAMVEGYPPPGAGGRPAPRAAGPSGERCAPPWRAFMATTSAVWKWVTPPAITPASISSTCRSSTKDGKVHPLTLPASWRLRATHQRHFATMGHGPRCFLFLHRICFPRHRHCSPPPTGIDCGWLRLIALCRCWPAAQSARRHGATPAIGGASLDQGQDWP